MGRSPTEAGNTVGVSARTSDSKSPASLVLGRRRLRASAGDPTDPAALAELLKEIPPINTWPISTAPGAHPNRTNVVANNVVLLIRGKLLKRYPNAIIYVGKAKKTLHRMPIPTIESSTRATNRSDESGANVALECDHIDCKSILPPDSQYILSAPTWYPAFQIPVAVTARSASSHVQVSAADACRQLGG